jgi:CheY-like chemotaxis protein
MENGGKGHILVADDHHINRALFKGLLEHHGYRVTLVENGVEVLGALRAGTFDLIIMDCMMPEMDGFEATRAIRAADGRAFDPGIPILATTALATDQDRKACLAAGMNDHLAKPVQAEALFQQVEKLLRASPASPPERAAPGPRLQDILASMSGALAGDLEAWQAQLRGHSERREWRQAGALAHTIRGLADLMGEVDLSCLAAELEAGADGLPDTQCRELTECLIAALAELSLNLGPNLEPGR